MNDQESRVEALSERQKEILRLIAQHLQAKEVARMLDISESTVKTHTDAARRRLGVASSRDAAKLLVAYEAKSSSGGGAILPEGGWPPRPMAQRFEDVSRSDHEHALPSERTVFPDPLERSGDRLENAGNAGKTGTDRGYASHAADVGQERRQRESDLYHGRSDSVADGRWGGFERWLKSLSAVQWLGMMILAGFLIMLATGGLIASAVGTMQAIKELRHQAG